MKHRLLEILCCPECNSSFLLHVYKVTQQDLNLSLSNSARCKYWCALNKSKPEDVTPSICTDCFNEEIIEGKLTCKTCNNHFPIIMGVPRILPKHLLAESLATYHTDFQKRYHKEFPIITEIKISTDKKKIKTLHSFSYQWTTFIDNFDYFKSIFLSFVHSFLAPKDFDGKLVLEVGCGSGRPASVAASFGAEVIAMDLSEAVQTAQSISKHYPLLHVVQADANALPFKPYFDFVYSVGVIQHLPDPTAALRSISKVIPNGHPLIIWVYGIREWWYLPVDILRKVTVKFPFRLLHIFSLFLAILSEIFILTPYRIILNISILKKFAERIPGRIYAKFPFRENIVGWFDRLSAPVTHYFSKKDVEDMLRSAGFQHIEVIPRPNASASWIARAIQKK